MEMLSNLGTPIVGIAIAALASLVTNLLFDEKSKKKSKAKDKLLNLLQENLEKGRVLDLELIGHIKQSVEREFGVEIAVTHLLQDILLKLNEASKDSDHEKIDALNIKLKELINQENKAAPFENLPEEERRLLKGLDDAIKHNDESSIQFHFDELNSVLSVRNAEHSRATKLNKWSVPLAVVGLTLTIIFGVIGMNNGVNDDDIKKTIKSTIESELKAANNANAADAKSRAAD
ncbi:MAG: hypothetical protein ACT6FE_06930 [Methanosarcinaceae archaeon]